MMRDASSTSLYVFDLILSNSQQIQSLNGCIYPLFLFPAWVVHVGYNCIHYHTINDIIMIMTAVLLRDDGHLNFELAVNSRE